MDGPHAAAGQQTIYEAVGRYDRLLQLAHTWHELCLADPLANHPFSHPGIHPQHTERLAAYLSEALGGPALYTDSMGDETYMQRLHAGNGVHEELDERCLALFDRALIDAGVPEAARPTMSAYFRWAARGVSAYPESPDQVPDALPLPHWSWNGPTD